MTVTPISAPASFSVDPANIPSLPLLSLSESELSLIKELQARARVDRADIEVEQGFYEGSFLVPNLRIAIPDELWQRLRILVGWGRVAVDPYVERLSCEGFRLPGGTDVDRRLGEMWDANGLASEQALAFTDALSMRRAYWMVGTDPDGSDMPRITAESPLNMTVLWDTSGRRARAAMQAYKFGNEERAAVMTPGQTITLAKDDRGHWNVMGRDRHDFGYVPVVRMANDPRTYNREGYSNITPELQTLIVTACQREVELAVASNLYSTPRLLLLGAALSAFQDASGNAVDAWKSYISLINVLEADEEGNLPEVKQLQTYDPSTYTKVIDHLASQAAGILAAVPQDLGLYTEGNPTSMEAYQVAESRRDRRAALKQRTFGVALAEVMQLGMRFQNNGSLPREFERIAVDWADMRMQSPAIISDAIGKQVAAGSVPPRSDVTLRRLGYGPVERAQMEQDWVEEDRRAALRRSREKINARTQPPAVTDGAAG